MTSGAVALVGSGEYLPAMEEIDRFLLNTLPNPQNAKVVLIPTASGLEPGMPARWSQLGVEHFVKIGAKVEPAMIIKREDTTRPEVLHKLRDADFYYFSGGNPMYLVETLIDTPAWEIILNRHRQGAALAGCSAGAMAFGGFTLNMRSAFKGQTPAWMTALSVEPSIVTYPHFDHMHSFVSPELFKAIISSAPPGVLQFGIDEDTALVRSRKDNGWEWSVMGKQNVTLFRGGKDEGQIFKSGETLNLEI
ncbi:Type 1 glutamine amidotransferase-like domain-containing protein [Candidatus Chlorohelix sp.]|uniref:Type 1 glutamine amidotransferase-like domain-containing protein n=1 Tax=Candidatus Chlorohelix sp. TaxID=3139201 RepID=UPI00302B0171